MIILKIILASIAGYFVGSISMARFIAKIFAPEKNINKTEVALEGSDVKIDIGFVSATTVSMQLGAKFGFMTMILDMLKIILPALFIKYLFPEKPYFLITAAMGMVGHAWPIYHRFKGGRGILAVYGGLFAVDWIGVFVTSIGGMLFGLLILRDVLAAYLAGVIFIIPWLWFRTHNYYYLFYGIAVNVILAISTIPELKQWMKIKKEEKWDDPTAVLQLTGMGRGIIKMAKLLGVVKTGRSDEQTN